jgi:hypothetical protein
MKITKRQLRGIIKEEKTRLLKESDNPANELDLIVDELRSQGLEDLAVRLEDWFEPMRFDWKEPDPYGARSAKEDWLKGKDPWE